MKSGLQIKDKMAKMFAAIRSLPTSDVLVGVPEEESQRHAEPGEKQSMSNAALAYIHNNGAPEAHIPARPFMELGLQQALPRITNYFRQAALLAGQGKKEAAIRAYEAAGMTAQNEIRKVIQAGSFQPLAEATLKARARRQGKKLGHSIAKGAQQELAARAAGEAASTANAKPLIDTGQMLKSITYVVRSGKPAAALVVKKEKNDANA